MAVNALFYNLGRRSGFILLDLWFDPRIQHMPEGNDIRLRGLSNIKLDEAWKHELSQDDQDFFEREGGTINRKLGYL